MFYNINHRKSCVYICISEIYMQDLPCKMSFEMFRKFCPFLGLLHERIDNLLHLWFRVFLLHEQANLRFGADEVMLWILNLVIGITIYIIR